MTSGRIVARFYSGLVLMAGLLTGLHAALAQYPAAPQLLKDGTAILLEDYADVPLGSMRFAGPYPAAIDYRGQLGKVNALRSEPAEAPQSKTRFVVVGQNGILYHLNKATKEFIPYIDFGKVFPRFNTDPNLGMGVVTMQFDPAYAKNGKFYTIHTENPGSAEPAAPTNAAMPGLDLNGHTTTPVINPPAGEGKWESIITEWTDTDIGNSTFEGSAREILRIGTNFARHPVADLIFNPLVRPGDADYGNLYISTGDGEAGERAGVTHTTPQRLDALQGKILRITPDITLRPNDRLGANGRYRIPSTGPNANPFVSVSIARPEIYAYGLRNPHRMSWDPVSDTFIAADIGNHSWEELNIITRGTNYGWAEREGPEQTFVGGPNGGRTAGQIDPPPPFPSPDLLNVEGLEKPVAPAYPVAAYSHRDGIAMGGGFVYRGKAMPQLVGKYLFSDIPSGRLFYVDLAEMRAAWGTNNKQAKINELQIVYKSPYDNAAQGAVNRRMFDIVADAYINKKGVRSKNCVLPDGSSNPKGVITCGPRGHGPDPYGVEYGGGRADVRLAMDGDGELYVLSKSDGMIRKIVSVVTPPPAKAAGR